MNNYEAVSEELWYKDDDDFNTTLNYDLCAIFIC